jgi:hypothetical protein
MKESNIGKQKKKMYTFCVKGRSAHWEFNIYAEPHDALSWQLDGLDIIETYGIIPEWYKKAGLPLSWWAMFSKVHLLW